LKVDPEHPIKGKRELVETVMTGTRLILTSSMPMPSDAVGKLSY
jgi:hypothetical protein